MSDYGYEDHAPTLADPAQKSVEAVTRKKGNGSIFRRGSLFGGRAKPQTGDFTTTPTSASRTKQRRSSLFHVTSTTKNSEKNDVGLGYSHGVEVDAAMPKHKHKEDRNRRSKRRGTAAHINATNTVPSATKNEGKRRANRRMTVQHTTNNVSLQDPVPASKGNRRRRGSLFHVHNLNDSSASVITKNSQNSKDTFRRPNKASDDPIESSTSTSSYRRNHVNRSSKPRKKKMNAADELSVNLSEMEKLAEAIHRDPKSREMFQKRLEREFRRSGFSSDASRI